jgi:hypothetical protein
MHTNSIRRKMTPVLGTFCYHSKQKECLMIPEEWKLILVIYHKSRLQVLEINDVTLIFMRPFSHNQRCKQHQKLVCYMPTGLVAKLHSWIRAVDLHGRVALFVGCGAGEGQCEDLARFVLSARGMGGAIEYIHSGGWGGAAGLMGQTCMLNIPRL